MSSKFEIKMLLCQNANIPYELATIITSYIGKNEIKKEKIIDESLYLKRNNFRCRHKYLCLYDFSVY